MIRALLFFVFVALAPVAANAKILDIQDAVTPKGIHVWIVSDHSLPVIAINFAFKGGAVNDPADKQGVSQLLSNTLDEGAGDLDAKAFQAAMRDRAIDLSFSSTRDFFAGRVQTLVRHKDEAEKLLKLAVNAPRFENDAVERMKQANLTRIRGSLGDADWISSRLFYDRIYAGHPYAQNSGGTLASMSGMNAADLKAARARHFARDRLYVGIAGDISKNDALALVDNIFGNLPATVKTPEIKDAAMPAAGKPRFYAKEMPQTILSMAWPGIAITDPDYYAAQVMDYIYGGGSFSSRLMMEVREARGLTYGIYSSTMNLDHADRYVVGGSMQPQNVKPTIELVNSIAKSMADTPVTAESLQAAKDYLTGSLPLRFSSTARIADALVDLQLDNRPVTALDDYRAKINAVTAADVERVAGRIFKAAPIVVLVGAAPAGIDVDTVTVLPNTEGAPKKGESK